MATHSSILAWTILWTEEPGSLQSMELQTVGHDLANKHVYYKSQSAQRCLPLFTLVTGTEER